MADPTEAQEKPKRGRPTLMTPERVEKVLQSIRTGSTQAAACNRARISDETLRRWRKRSVDNEAAYKEAEGDLQVEALAGIRKAGMAGVWQAWAWLLERKWPQDFASLHRVEMRVELEREVERIATASGIDPADVWAEMREMGIPVPR